MVDLLDLALSADTVNTVKNLRVIMETGVEPLALMSQLATVITDILAGSYDLTKERHRRKFFRRRPCKYQIIVIIRFTLVIIIHPFSLTILQLHRVIRSTLTRSSQKILFVPSPLHNVYCHFAKSFLL